MSIALPVQPRRTPASPSVAVSLWAALWAGLAATLTTTAHADAELRWVPGETALDQQLAAYLTDSKLVSDFVVLLDENFELDPPLGLTVGSSLDAHGIPSYSSEDRRIRLPYAYLEKAIRAQAELVEGTTPEEDPGEGDAVRRAMDLVEYTIYHLVGHALVDDANVDVDDRAEAISSWLMISAWPNGAEQWLEDVQAFANASQQLDGPLEDYWHSHSLYKSREETLSCWALGADPDRIESLLPAVLDPAERREQCIHSWTRLDDQMRRLLDPVLKPNAPLRGNSFD